MSVLPTCGYMHGVVSLEEGVRSPGTGVQAAVSYCVCSDSQAWALQKSPGALN